MTSGLAAGTFCGAGADGVLAELLAAPSLLIVGLALEFAPVVVVSVMIGFSAIVGAVAVARM